MGEVHVRNGRAHGHRRAEDIEDMADAVTVATTHNRNDHPHSSQGMCAIDLISGRLCPAYQ